MDSDKIMIPQSRNYDDDRYNREYDKECDRKCDKKNDRKCDKDYDRECDKEYDKECDRKCDNKYDGEYNREYNKKECGERFHDRDRHDIKTIQTKVIKGKGSEDFFLEADFNFPEEAPLFLIESIDTWVDVYDTKVINEDKVIFNAWVYKNIIYKVASKTSEIDNGVTVTGPVKHITKAIPLAGCINIKLKGCEKLNCREDIAEVLKASVIGHVEEKQEKAKVCDSTPPVYVYGSLHEKMCVKVEVKVVRWEHVTIESNDKC